MCGCEYGCVCVWLWVYMCVMKEGTTSSAELRSIHTEVARNYHTHTAQPTSFGIVISNSSTLCSFHLCIIRQSCSCCSRLARLVVSMVPALVQFYRYSGTANHSSHWCLGGFTSAACAVVSLAFSDGITPTLQTGVIVYLHAAFLH